MADKLRVLCLKYKQIDIDYAEKLLKRMEARCQKKQHIFDYDIWKTDHPDYTFTLSFTIRLSGVLLIYNKLGAPKE